MKCGGRGEVRSHGGHSSLITAATAPCFIGGPFLVQVTHYNNTLAMWHCTYLALGLGIQKNARELGKSAYISVLFG